MCEGDFASESVKDLVVPHLVTSSGWQRVVSLLQQQQQQQQPAAAGDGDASGASAAAAAAAAGLPEALATAVRCMYMGADAELIELCRLHSNDYASSTSVTAIFAGGFLAVGHLVSP